MDFNALWQRLLRALKLENGVFAEIGNDPKATGEAVLIAAVSGLIGGIGNGGRGIITGAIAGVIGLAIGTGILFVVGKIFKGQGAYVQLFRGLGYATFPQIAGFIPIVGWLIGLWGVVMAVKSVQEINRVSMGAAVATVLIPAVILGILIAVVFVAFFAALYGAASS